MIPRTPSADPDGVIRTDVIVIGAGVAGLFAVASLPPSLDVVVVDKGVAGRSGSSPWAQGGMAVAIGPDDSPDLHAADTMAAGDHLCDARAVDVLCTEAPKRLAELIELGAQFDRHSDGSGADALHLAREGAQSAARSVHRADATGAEMVRALRDAVAPRVARLEGHARDLLIDNAGGVAGVSVLTREGDDVEVEGRAVLLASGGCGGIFAATTNQEHSTGDGVVLAGSAGAMIRDVAFVQFHPTGLATDTSWRFLLTEALRGAGATLHDSNGDRFLLGLHPDAELAPRHVVSSAILDLPEGRAWLDATMLGSERLAKEFPTVLAGARDLGFDMATQRVPVTPAAHYLVGGVATDLNGATSLRGLWAAGEVASTGVHGANRMAGNSLAEALVFGARAAEHLSANLGQAGQPRASRERRAVAPAATSNDDVRTRLRGITWAGLGPRRDATGLNRAVTELDALAEELADPGSAVAVEARSAVAMARLIGAEALARPETRGGHVRTDHPDRDVALDGVHLIHRNGTIEPERR